MRSNPGVTDVLFQVGNGSLTRSDLQGRSRGYYGETWDTARFNRFVLNTQIRK